MLTLRELKNMAETAPSGQKTPTARELRSSGKLIAERKIGGSAGIAAYRNGYAVYHAGRDATVFRIHACSGYCYDSGSSPCSIGGRMFDGEAWYLRLVLEGEDRLFRNLASREQDRSVSCSGESEEWGELYPRVLRCGKCVGWHDPGGNSGKHFIRADRKAAAGGCPVLPGAENGTPGRGGTRHYGPAVSRILAKSLARMRAGITGAQRPPETGQHEGRN